MKRIETNLKDCFIIEPRVFEDDRGHFFESYNKQAFEAVLGRPIDFVQDNQSLSKKGVLRGLHFQTGKYAQSKLVRVLSGEVLDVVVDLREDSPTFGQHFSMRLSGENRKMIFIPKGMGHGFLTLSDQAQFAYKCDEYYHKAAESGIKYDDKTLSIDWQYPVNDILLSQKDRELPELKALFQ